MSNDNYHIDFTNPPSFDTESQQIHQAPIPANENQPPVIQTGFPFINSTLPFELSIDLTNIDFGNLSATNPVTRTNKITVSINAAYGYDILSFEDHPLQNADNKALIPNTTCDNGTCSNTISSIWNSNLTYGLGYRCDNIVANNCSDSFQTENFYKQFSDNNLDKPAESMISGMTTDKSQSQITYKVNTSTSQPKGSYSNNIYYISIPKY